jgi:putative ABC transport system permease protein
MPSALRSLRRLGTQRATTLLLVSLVLVTAFVFAVAPRVVATASDGALRDVIGRASAFQGNVQLVQQTRIQQGFGEPLADVVSTGAELERRLPARVRALFDDRTVVVESIRWGIGRDRNPLTYLRMRFQERVGDHLRYVAGRAPTGAITVRPPPVVPPPVTGEERAGPITRFEGSLSTASATALHVKLGDVLSLAPDPRDPLVGQARRSERAELQIVGLFEIADPGARYWLDDTTLATPTVRTLSPDVSFLDAAAVLDPAAYPALLLATQRSGLPVRYTWRYYVQPDRVSAASLDGVVIDARRMESVFAAGGGAGQSSATALRSGLRAILETHRARWASAVGVLTVAAVGPAAVAVAALALVALLASRRGAGTFAVWRSRGASFGQVVAALLAEAVVVAIPAAMLAVALAVTVVAGPVQPLSLVAAGTVAAVTIVLLVATGIAASRHGPADRSVAAIAPSPRRLAFETVIIGAAIAGAYVVRERSIHAASSATELSTTDPFIAAVPALAAAAAALLAVRILPIPMRLLVLLAARRRGLVPILGMRSATRGWSAAAILVIVMTTVTVGAFAAATLGHLDRAAAVAAWQEVGAPYRLTAGGIPFPPTFDPKAMRGVEAAAGAFRAKLTVQAQGALVDFLAVDVDALRGVVRGTPADPGFPAEMTQPAALATSPLPAIVSTTLSGGGAKLSLGGIFDLNVHGTNAKFRVVSIRDTYPSLPPGEDFIVISRDQFRAATPGSLPETSVAFLRAPDGAGPRLRDAAADIVSAAVIDSRDERSAELGDAPVLHAIAGGVAAAAAVALAYGALGVAAAVALAGASRSVEIAHLRTLGLSRREALQLIVAEHVPPAIAALVAGIALGIGLFAVLRPGLGLTALVGSDVDVPLSVNATEIALLVAGIAAIAGIGILLGAALQRSATPATAIRRGIE